MTYYTDNVHRVFNGRILVYIQSNDSTEPIKVQFTSPWLKATEVTINVK